jgi:hypothetical protein
MLGLAGVKVLASSEYKFNVPTKNFFDNSIYFVSSIDLAIVGHPNNSNKSDWSGGMMIWNFLAFSLYKCASILLSNSMWILKTDAKLFDKTKSLFLQGFF